MRGLESAVLVAAAAGALAMLPSLAQAQDQCLSLRGSTQCPSFQDAYINPTNLSRAWPWMANVRDVASFDEQFSLYFTDSSRWTQTKIVNQLQCNRSAASNVAVQWERSWLCGQFSQISYSASCNVMNRVQPIMLCQSTCLDFAGSEKMLVANPQICAPDNQLSSAANQTRYFNLNKDYVSCTDWTTLVSENNQTCITGASNEGNCGWGPGTTTQLCEMCDPTGNKAVPSCCFDSKTDLASCGTFGHPGAALIRPTTSVAPGFATSTSSPSASGTAAPAGADASSSNNGTNLSGGQLAGIIVGCVVGALLLGAIIAALLFRRKRRNAGADPESSRAMVYGGSARGSGEKWTQSDEGTTRISRDHEKVGSPSPTAMGGAAAAAAGVGAAAMLATGSGDSNPDRPISGVTTSSGTDGRGTTVPSVRDQYTGQDIFPGEEVIAIYPYNAALNDEITLEPDQRITIMRLYDDGWALGKTADGVEGALPLVCISSLKGDVPRPGGNNTGTSDDEGLTSGQDYTSSVEAFTADEGGFTSDAASRRTR